MAIYDTRLGEIINALGRYYSIVSKEKFMPILAFGGEEAISDFGTVNFDPTPEVEKLVATFMDATEGGVIMKRNFEALKDVLTSDDDPSGNALDQETVDKAKALFRYHGEPETFIDVMALFDQVCSTVSVKDMCKITPSAEGGTDGTINGAFSSPTKFTPNLCALEVFNPKLVPAVRDTGAAGLFMNAIPTLEFSRCQPYLDITLVSPNFALNSDGRIQTIGLMQHLLGQSIPNDADYDLAQAIDESAVQGQLEQQDAANAAGIDGAPGSDQLSSTADVDVATAGMEMFTAPQTLVPIIGERMETHGHFEAYQITEPGIPGGAPPVSAGGRRGAPIIDPFRPLMTIEGFDVTVTPSKGMMSHKTAELSLILHDRSRMTEIAEFVKPDLYGKSELMITYGWSHPDDSARIGDSSIRGNFYGSFLNAMKVTEKYMIVNSSFSFDEVGQVKIKLKLSMKGATNLSTNNIAQGEDVEDATKALKAAIEVIQRLKKQALEDAAATGSAQEARDVFGESFFKAASDTSRAMTMDEETAAALQKYISENRGASGTTGDLASALETAFGSDGQGGAVAELQKTIADAVAAKLDHIKQLRRSNKDAFAKKVTGAGGSTRYVNIPKNSRKHVSFGALLMYMVGKPLAATKRFDEVQFVFYPVNDKASYLKDLTTAQIPININDFEGVFKENTKTSVNLPLGRFLGMVSKEFIHNQAAEAYGLASLFDTDDEGNKKIKESLKENPTKLNDEKKKRLEDAYGEGQDITFKMPRIRFHLEAVPAKDTGHEIGRRATILRIHVYDYVCTPNTALHKLLTAARSNSLGMLTTAATQAANQVDETASSSDDADISVDHATAFVEQIQAAIAGGLLEPVPSMSAAELENFDPTAPGAADTYFRIKGGFPALKNFVMGSMPSIIYGSTNSAVISADLSSMNNPQLATVNMMRAGMGGGSTAQGARDAGLPLQTSPVALNLNTFGCPAINYGQSFFVDFGTGTTIDNVFVVTGIEHSISQGKFETKVKMTQVDAFGKYISTMTTLTKTLAALRDAGSDESTPTPT